MARIIQPLKGNRLAPSGLRPHAAGVRSFLILMVFQLRRRGFGLSGKILMIFPLIAILIAALAGPVSAQRKGHMTVADPASLSGARAEEVYQAIRARLAERYAGAGDPVTQAYQSWRRYNTAPYRSGPHGKRFVNNYANKAASGYGRFEKIGELPEGAMVAKDSFIVAKGGQVLTGPFFLMEKKYDGFNPAGRDWLYMMVGADGALVGITGGEGSKKVEFCGTCHNNAPRGQDGLWLLPEKWRRR